MSDKPFKKSVNDVVTFFPNVLIDEIMPICGEEEWKVISALVYIGACDFEKMKKITGMKDEQLRLGIDQAIQRGIVRYSTYMVNTLRINYDFEIQKSDPEA